jgi:hypothetical protein
MRIVAYAKHGLFKGKEEPFGAELYELQELLIETVSKGEGLSFETESGSVHIPDAVVKDSIFMVEL